MKKKNDKSKVTGFQKSRETRFYGNMKRNGHPFAKKVLDKDNNQMDIS
jgi:hypothetical protein